MIKLSFKAVYDLNGDTDSLISSLGFGVLEAQRIKEIKNKSAQALSLAARSALRDALGNNEEHIILRTENRKPYFDDASLLFSLSHSDPIAVAALSDSEIGVDLEFIDPERRTSDIARRFFSNSERSRMSSAIDPILAFYALWTKKEAYAKLTGKGLTENLSRDLPRELFVDQYLLEDRGKKAILSVCHTKDEQISVLNERKDLILSEFSYLC